MAREIFQIDEAAAMVGVEKHVLRFWETRFSAIQPMRAKGKKTGRRFYRLRDISTLNGVRKLLYDHRFTIEGVQQISDTKGVEYVRMVGDTTPHPNVVLDDVVTGVRAA